MGKIRGIFRNIKLVWRLLWDRRVPLILKMFIPMSLSYLAMPFDLVRDYLPVIGRFDDLIILTIATLVFVRLAPQQVVTEHREAIWGRSVNEGKNVTDADYRVLNDDDREETDNS